MKVGIVEDGHVSKLRNFLDTVETHVVVINGAP